MYRATMFGPVHNSEILNLRARYEVDQCQGNSKNVRILPVVYRVSQEERSVFWEVIVSVILSKKLYMNMCPIPNGFRDRAIWMQTAELLIRKRYYEYVLFLIPVFIVQVTELVKFIINVRKFHRQHQRTLQLVWGHGVLFVWVRLDFPLCRW